MAQLTKITTKDGIEMYVSGEYLEIIKSLDLCPEDITKNGIQGITTIRQRILELENKVDMLQKSRENFIKSII